MSLFAILIVLAIAGAIVLLFKLLPIDQIWKTIAYVIVGLFVLVWIFRHLKAAGYDMTI